jgi:murein L,D-transpeptidase YcbB/YkuD
MESRLHWIGIVKRLLFLTLTLILWGTAAGAELRLDVDLSDRQLAVIVDGDVVETFPVAIGKEDNPTPQGDFRIRKVIFNPSWVPPNEKWAKGKTPKPPGHPENPMKRVKMFFKEPDYYIHGTGDEDSLGEAASHGCLRMSPDDVTRLAKLVMEHGGKPMPEPWYKRIFRRKATKVIYLTAPVPVAIRGVSNEVARK